MSEAKRLDIPELVEKCMPALERFEEVEKQVFYPIPKPVEFSSTIRIYASTMAREAIRKAIALISPLIEDAKKQGIEQEHKAMIGVAVDEGNKAYKNGVKAERERIIGWMGERCPHSGGLEEQKVYKSDCPQCWQALSKEE